MLANNKLLIDQNCPMCKIYGACFTKLELIDRETIQPYQVVEERFAQQIDMGRARNEIALHDAESGDTTYGIDAMIKIVSHGRPLLQGFLSLKPIHWALHKLYSFISYNRKVIYPAAQESGQRDCTPEVHFAYRAAYILLGALVVGVVLNTFAAKLSTAFDLKHFWWREYLISFGQIGWQLAAVSLIARPKWLDYLGNMTTVSLIGAILLLPILYLDSHFDFQPWILLIGFAGVVGTMLLEHIRRCKLLEVPLKMTFSWVGYRVIVLSLILMALL